MEQEENLVGEILDNRYHLAKWLGGGNFGSVYVADDKRFIKSKVAIKVTRVESTSTTFKREANLIRELNHPNIVKVFDYGSNVEIRGIKRDYLVMEYLSGKTLEDLLDKKNRQINWELFEAVVMGIGKALSYIHSQNLIHRDLKPSNILFADQENESGDRIAVPKLIDFGISGKVDATSKTLANHTQAGFGTILYMAPEVFIHGDDPNLDKQEILKAGRLRDIYAFGVILYEVLSCSIPFKIPSTASAADIFKIANIIINDVAKPLTDFPHLKDLPPEIDQLVMRCIEKDPKKRIQSVNEIIESYQQIRGTNEDIRRTSVTKYRTPYLLYFLLACSVVAPFVYFWMFPANPVTVPELLPPTIKMEPAKVEIEAGDSREITLVVDNLKDRAIKSIKIEGEDGSTIMFREVPEKKIVSDNTSILTYQLKTKLGEEAVRSNAKIRAIVELEPDASNDKTDQQLISDISLVVKKPEIFIPPAGSSGFNIAPKGEWKKIDNRILAEQLVISVPEAEPIVLQLISNAVPRVDIGAKVKSFYISRYKISNKQFSSFVKHEKFLELISKSDDPALKTRFEQALDPAKKNQFDESAVQLVSMNEALAFAQFAGGIYGTLPSLDQWFVAAGYYDMQKEVDAPSMVPISERVPNYQRENYNDTFSVKFGDKYPSPYGICQMGFNGLEWLRNYQEDTPDEREYYQIGVQIDSNNTRVDYKLMGKSIFDYTYYADADSHERGVTFRMVISTLDEAALNISTDGTLLIRGR